MVCRWYRADDGRGQDGQLRRRGRIDDTRVFGSPYTRSYLPFTMSQITGMTLISVYAELSILSRIAWGGLSLNLRMRGAVPS